MTVVCPYKELGCVGTEADIEELKARPQIRPRSRGDFHYDARRKKCGRLCWRHGNKTTKQPWSWWKIETMNCLGCR